MAKQRFRDVKQGRSARKTSKKTKNDPKRYHAGIRDRLKAFITDTFMLLMPIMYIVFYLIMSGREEFAQQKMAGWAYILVPLIMAQTVFIAKSGQTPGMRAYNIKVVDLKTGKMPVSVTRIVLRQILGVIDFLLFGWIVMFFRSDHRTPHELLTDTAIVYDIDGMDRQKS